MRTPSSYLSEYPSQLNEEILNPEIGTSQMMKLFEEQLKNMLWAERALIKAFPKMISLSTSDNLILALTDHIQQSHEQVTRIAKVFRTIDRKPAIIKCDAIEKLINEAAGVMKDCEKGRTCDARIIDVAQRIALYKISAYQSLRKDAETLGLREAEVIFVNAHKIEQEADQELNEVAIQVVHTVAASAQA